MAPGGRPPPGGPVPLNVPGAHPRPGTGSGGAPRGEGRRTRVPHLHLVTDDRVLRDPAFSGRAAAALDAGGGDALLHVRGPGASGRELLEAARAVGRPGSTVVNDRVDVALVLGGRGAHLGNRSLPPRAAREILGPDALLGRSVHDASTVSRMADSGDLDALDFLLVGTLFDSGSHPGRPGAGTDRLGEVFAALRGGAGGRPAPAVLGIGGVTPERTGAVVAAGAHGIAALGGIWDAHDPARAVVRYLEGIVAALAGREQEEGR